jgi:urea carboxylase
MPRTRARQFRPSSGLLTRARIPLRRAHRDLGRGRHAGHAVLRSACSRRSSSRARIARAALAACDARGARSDDARRHRNQSRLFAATRRRSTVRGRRHDDARARELRLRAATVEVLSAGTQTTIQDYPGRLGFWSVGVPPSGPMDSLSFRLANRALGNSATAAALEMTVRTDAQVQRRCLDLPRPARMAADLDGEPVHSGSRCGRTRADFAHRCRDRSRLPRLSWRFAAASTCRPIWAAAPPSRSASSAVTAAAPCCRATCCTWAPPRPARRRPARAVPPALIPEIGDHGNSACSTGRTARRIFSRRGHRGILRRSWEVHYNSSRTGVRLIGPKPQWARSDGGEAGLHPSNIHDNAYAIGSVDFTGDMPVIWGPMDPRSAASSVP